MNKNWLDRDILNCGPIILCINDKEYTKALKDLGIYEHEYFLPDNAGAAVYTFNSDTGKKAYIVNVRDDDNIDGIQMACLIVHEAVHIWQFHKKMIGETDPGMELEAYIIQTISQKLMDSYKEKKYGNKR